MYKFIFAQKRRVKQYIIGAIGFLVLLATVLVVLPATARRGDIQGTCTQIKDKVLRYPEGHYLEGDLLQIGYDSYGYNYQTYRFEGYYANAFLGEDGYPPYTGNTDDYLSINPGVTNTWYWEYRDITLMMKWNNAWLSNQDCDKDGKLDIHYGLGSYIGSWAQVINYQWGTYPKDGVSYYRGNTCKWRYTVKIVAAPKEALLSDEVWYYPPGTEMGPVIWRSFAVVLEDYNDPCGGMEGADFLSPAGPGFQQNNPSPS